MNSASDTASPLTAPAGVARVGLVNGRTILFGLLALGAVAWGIRFGLHAYHYEATDDAYVTGHLHQISSQLDGQVKEVLVEENQSVRAGDVLFRLDPLEFQIAAQKAEAGLAQAHAQEAQTVASASQAVAALEEARARVAQAEAQLAQADAQLALSKLTLSRSEQLLTHEGATTQADVDNARTAAQAAQANSRAAQANLIAAKAAVGSAESAQASIRAQATAAAANAAVAEAACHDAERRLAQATIIAPAAGRIGNKHLEPGDRVQAGQALLALAEPAPWIVANFKETQLAHMAPGQEVELTIDALPGRELRGRIDSLSPASGARFALLPPDNSTGNFNKVVQRVPVKITLDADSRAELGDRLRMGLSVVVDVRVR